MRFKRASIEEAVLMNIKQLVEQAKANAPLQLGLMADAKAANLLREAFAVILAEIDKAGDEPVKIAGLGSFRVRQVEVEKDGLKQPARRVFFKPAPPKA